MLEEAVSESRTYLSIGKSERKHVHRANAPEVLDGEVTTLIEDGQGVVETLEGQVEVRAGQSHAFQFGHMHRRHLRQHVDEGSTGASVEPVVGHIT